MQVDISFQDSKPHIFSQELWLIWKDHFTNLGTKSLEKEKFGFGSNKTKYHWLPKWYLKRNEWKIAFINEDFEYIYEI